MTKIEEYLLNFFRLTRPLSNLKNIAIVVLAFYFSRSPFDLQLFVWGILSLSFISSAIYGYNTINDLELDKDNSNKKYYAESINFFGKKKSLLIVLILVIIGLGMGVSLGYEFFGALVLLLATGFLYSSRYTRFKEKVGLDILCGAFLTFSLRFAAAWFIFSEELPYVLPILALAFVKTGGYTLYKGLDRDYLLKKNINNTITRFSLKSLLIFSWSFFGLTLLSIILMIVNPVYLHINILGSLPMKILLLTPFAIPPIIVIFFQIIKKTKFQNSLLRFWGYIYMFLTIIAGCWILK